MNTTGENAQVRIKQHFAELQEGVLRLGALTCEFIPRGTEVLLTGDLAAAQELIDADDELDALSVELDDLIVGMLIRQAPLASDLRHLVSSLRIVAELERSADLMVNVAKGSRRLRGAPASPRVRGVIQEMADEANRLMRASMDAFADGDESLAAALADMDDRLDELNREMVRAVFDAHAAGEIDLYAAVQLSLIARYYERIGDHAVNIGERVRYWRSGWQPEQTGAARVAQRSRQEPETS